MRQLTQLMARPDWRRLCKRDFGNIIDNCLLMHATHVEGEHRQSRVAGSAALRLTEIFLVANGLLMCNQCSKQ